LYLYGIQAAALHTVTPDVFISLHCIGFALS